MTKATAAKKRKAGAASIPVVEEDKLEMTVVPAASPESQKQKAHAQKYGEISEAGKAWREGGRARKLCPGCDYYISSGNRQCPICGYDLKSASGGGGAGKGRGRSATPATSSVSGSVAALLDAAAAIGIAESIKILEIVQRARP